jgi:hypothetical protein
VLKERNSRRNRWEEINVQKKSVPPLGTQISRSGSKKESSREEKLFAVLKEKLLNGSTKETEANYEYTLFMLSLVPELNNVPEMTEMDVKLIY